MRTLCAVAGLCLAGFFAVAQDRAENQSEFVPSATQTDVQFASARNTSKSGGDRATDRERQSRKARKQSIAISTESIDPSQIDIVRDAYGVPHIFAKTDPEVAYGLAWAHSEDDFETIQKTILASKSMLGLHTGRDGATVDYIVHLLRLRELVSDRYESDISDEYKAVLQGYCDGLNAFARTHPKGVLVKRAFPVTPKDILAYSVLQLAIGCGVEGALKKIYSGAVPTTDLFPNDLGPDGAQGSNAFAFNSKKTADGNVYLAINTHHPLEGLVAWYEAHLSSEEGWNILGSLFPGSPVIFTGVNDNLAWTHTVNHPDKLDVYQLEMHPVNELMYRVDGEWRTLEETVVKLKIKVPGFNLHVKKKAYWSIYGPTIITEKGTFSVRTGGIMDIRALEQWYRMNKATSYASFRKALKMEAIPAYNLVYGDRYDTIFYLSNGKLPFRDPSFNWKGTLPGNTSRTLWNAFHPLEDLPQVLNPSSGYVFNANHSPFKATAAEDNLKEVDFDPTLGYETHDNNRSLRVGELLSDLHAVSYADFKRIKYDLQLPKKLAFPVNIDTLFMLDERDNPEIADLITTLKKWDRKGTTDSKGAAVFAISFYQVADRYSKDETFTSMSAKACIETLQETKRYLIKNFGKTNITLGDYQKLERGDRTLPLPGLPDVLASMYSTPSENGRVKGTVGDCYIGFIKFTPAGPQIETINAFGASTKRTSKHYDDQMKMFVQQKTKSMTINKDEVYQSAETIYHPEVFSKIPGTRLSRNR
jgi:acyl-homoserine-lactone acylase